MYKNMCTYICIYICIYIYTCIYVHIFFYMHVCMHVYINTNMYIHTSISKYLGVVAIRDINLVIESFGAHEGVAVVKRHHQFALHHSYV